MGRVVDGIPGQQETGTFPPEMPFSLWTPVAPSPPFSDRDCISSLPSYPGMIGQGRNSIDVFEDVNTDKYMRLFQHLRLSDISLLIPMRIHEDKVTRTGCLCIYCLFKKLSPIAPSNNSPSFGSFPRAAGSERLFYTCIKSPAGQNDVDGRFSPPDFYCLPNLGP